MFPGFTGYYFMHHFMPYLQMRITTPEQQALISADSDVWDTTTIHVPLFTRLISYLQYKLNRLNLFDQTKRWKSACGR